MKYCKPLTSILPAAALLLIFSACAHRQTAVVSEQRQHADAVYRGAFIDEGFIQVNVQFTLKDGIVKEASFRHLVGSKVDYNLDTEEEPYRSVVNQYQEALQHLVGKPLSEHLPDLYNPGSIVTREVDGYSGATIRANKIISAIRDALNRGPYEI